MDSEKLPDKYWTGTKFSSDINEAKEFISGRALANALSKARDVAESDNTITEKGVMYTDFFDSTEEEDAFKDVLRAIQKRSTDTDNNSVDTSILKPDGSIDGDKLQTLIDTRLAESRAARVPLSLLSTGGPTVNNNEITYETSSTITKPAGFGK